MFLQEPAVDRLALQLAVRLDRVAFYDQRPRALLAPVLVVGLIGSMSRTIGVPLPHQSHFRLWAPIDQLQLWPQAVHTYEIPPLSPRT